MRDPAFKAEAQKEHIEIDEIPGPDVQKIIEQAYALPPEVVKAAKEAMNVGGASD
jgi:hypothetical protein